MMQTYNGSLAVFYGDKQQQINKEDIGRAVYVQVFDDLIRAMSLQNLIVLDQQHTALGLCVDETIFMKNNISLYEYIGDYIITDQKRTGLLILTADCLPIILHDRKKNIVGLAHAGWKGSALGITSQLLLTMQKAYQSFVQDIHVYFGINAQSCCYEVSFDFIKNFELYDYAQKAFIKRNNKLYFDNKMFTTLHLQKIGIAVQNIYNMFEGCTICYTNYCSVRREKEQAGRQITVVALI